MKVEEVQISSLSPLPNNPRHHSASQVEKIKESIERFGFTNPILAHKDNTIIARYKANGGTEVHAERGSE